MAELKDLSRTDDDNDGSSLLGWPEDMPRSDVNDRARQLSGALRRWYHDGEWVLLLEEQGSTAFSISKLSDTAVRIANADASGFFSVGIGVRLSNAGAGAVYGYVSAIVSGDPTDLTIDFPPSGTLNEAPGSTWSGFGTSGSPTPATTLANFPVVAGSVLVEDTTLHSRGLSLSDDGAGNLVHAIDGTVGTINYATGAIAVNGLSEVFDSNVAIDYQSNAIVPASCNRVEHYFLRSARESAFRDLGTGIDEIPTNFDLGTAAYKNEGPSGGLDADTLDGKHASDIVDEVTLASRNFIINGSFRVAQRGTTITAATSFLNSDDSYVMDRWLLLSDGNDRVDVSRDTSVPTGPNTAHNSMKLTVATVTGSPSSEQFGICQIIEAKDSASLIGQNVSMGFWAKATGTLNFARAAVLSWTSTEDVVTSDLVSSWSVGVLTGRTVADWTVEGETDRLTLNAGWTFYPLEDISIDASGAKNVAVFIWIDENDFATTDTLFVSAVQLEIGANASTFRDREIGYEQKLCERYFQKTFDTDVEPVQNIGATIGCMYATLQVIGANGGSQWRLPTPMFKAPTVVTYNPAAADANWDSGDVPTVAQTTRVIEITGATGLSDGDAIHVTAEAEL